MAKRRTPPRNVWDGDDFVDITSHSTGEPPQRTRPLKEPARGPRPPQRPSPNSRPRPPAGRAGERRPPPPPGRPKAPTRPNPKGRPPRPGEPKRPARPGAAPPPERRPKRPPPPRKRRPPMKKGVRRLLMLGTILFMLAVTCVLAVSLLFKISEITVTGDIVYETQDILKICDYKAGDNLLFISTSDRVKKLKAQLPYISDVEIRRHLPGTLEIHITGTQVACCIYAEGAWLYVSGDGKILEIQAEPREGVMQIEGITPQSPQVGARVELEDEGTEEAYATILAKIVELGAWGEFTRLDITDPYNITLWYQDRVECKLGNANELDYKVQFGYKLFQGGYIGPEETGVLDLSYADVRRGGFTSQPVDPAARPSSGGSSPETGPDPASGGEDGEESSGGRGDDIPDEPMA